MIAEQMRSLSPWRFAILFAFAFTSLVWLINSLVQTLSWDPPGLLNAAGANVGRDFVAFWAAADFALKGDLVGAYDHDAMQAAQVQTVGALAKYYPWFYPPFVQMLVAPLALMPYLIALGVWMLAPLLGLLLIARRYVAHAWGALAALIFPGTAQCLIVGQNGVLSALIVGGGLLKLETNPAVAGAILGLLSYKPQIAVTVYAALLFGRHWLSLGAAIAVAFVLLGLSLLAFGAEPWMAFLRESQVAKGFLETGHLPWSVMATVFASARLAGLGLNAAYALQAIVALGAFAALFLVWSRKTPLSARAAVLAAAIPLTTPYGFSYDLVVVVLALVWLAKEGLETGFRRGELVVFTIAWIAPAIGWIVAEWYGVLLTPIAFMLLLGVLLRRIFVAPGGLEIAHA